MAFPTTAGVTTSTLAANGLSSVITFAACTAGDLVIAILGSDSGAGANTWPAPWVVLKDEAGTGFEASVAYLIATGGETSVTVTHASERSNHIAVRIAAGTWHGTTPPEITAAVTGNSAGPDSGNLTPSWGAADTKWMAILFADDSATPFPVTAFPASYGADQTSNVTTLSACAIAIATRDLNAASDDPGAWTMTAIETWNAYTLAIRPAAGGGAQSVLPGAIALTLGTPAPTIAQQVQMGAIALALGLPAPTIALAGAQTLTPPAIPLTLGLPAPTISVAVPFVFGGRLRDIQYHAVIFSPDANGGPGVPKYELDADILNMTWQQGLNFPGQAAFSMSRFNPKLAGFAYMQDHIKIFREDSRATKCVFAGKIVKPAESARDTIIYAWDYVAFLQRSRTGYRILYPEKTLKEIIDAEWALAKAAGTSLFSFVATGTTETPLGLDGVTPIKTNSQFGVVDFDRLYLFNALAEIGMANTANTVVFEITREAPHTFNFWKNRNNFKTSYHFAYPGNLVDYDLDDGTDQIVNDLATVILDGSTGAQVEYALADNPSIALYRRLQASTTIKTLFGLAAGTTESDQQKAALARMLTISAGIPRLVTAFPRQGEITPFDNWELGEAFRTTIQKADRSGDRLDAYLKATGIAAAWTPEAGELLQVFLR